MNVDPRVRGSTFPTTTSLGPRGASLTPRPPKGAGRAPYSPQSGTMILGSLEGIPGSSKQGILTRFIHRPCLTRNQSSLTRLDWLLPRHRTASKVDVLRRTSSPQACGEDVHRRPCRTRSGRSPLLSKVRAKVLARNVFVTAHACACAAPQTLLLSAREGAWFHVPVSGDGWVEMNVAARVRVQQRSLPPSP